MRIQFLYPLMLSFGVVLCAGSGAVQAKFLTERPSYLPRPLVSEKIIDVAKVFGLDVRIWLLESRHEPILELMAGVQDCLILPSSDELRVDCLGDNFMLTLMWHDDNLLWTETLLTDAEHHGDEVYVYRSQSGEVRSEISNQPLATHYYAAIDKMQANAVAPAYIHDRYQGSFVLSYQTDQGVYSVVGWEQEPGVVWLTHTLEVRE
ncbi:hypothetical protein [Aliidiomarina haloalkalitolerans]|uniref:Uncharacterized protein n=1 Tax=Aliidiomarina haloalkalitolerans TaxID=859059 RepID=A0A432VZ73_9GAMM|nr:hypothetical protein [Aliidiomarina haloalkalitolerans]RUO21962.1 hypothetical protein CWE06_03725 [Aliidiomarina haloalkalitolerans]